MGDMWPVVVGTRRGPFEVSTVTSLLLPWSVETTRTSGALLLVEAADEALEAASRIMNAFLGDVNEDRVCSWSLLTLDAADMDKS